MADFNEQEKEALDRERYQVLAQVEEWLEIPVLILGFFWLILLVIELLWGLSPFMENLFYLTWGIFVFDFLIRFILAPYKISFLKTNWLTAISLLVPALRVLQVFRMIYILRLAQATRGLRLVAVVGSLNRGMRALRASFTRRGFGYIAALTLIVSLVGAAGMFAFEGGETGFQSYGDALYWTAMIMTTLGSGSWPLTAEGRILGFLLSLYAFGVFGYVTAALATFFIGQEAEHEEAELVGAKAMNALREEISSLRAELRHLDNNASTTLSNNLDDDP
jgi:voltage-gated potassium channel